MHDTFTYSLIVAVGVGGGLLGLRYRLPAGAMLGALVAVVTLHTLLPSLPSIPAHVRTWLQIVVGAALGSRANPDSLRKLRQALPATGLMMAGTLLGVAIGSVIVASAIHAKTGEALLSGTPGGMPEMVLLASALGLDVDTVLSIQLTRVTLSMFILVPLARLVVARSAGSGS
jgi:membrane AbrB-like protein